MISIRQFVFIACITSLLSCFNAYAIWYESSGQAVIHNGNKEQARQHATQEAIKQALLFAGASINSVQRLTNGLLTDDHLEIRSSGEVDTIELIDEIYEGDVLTVSIRADIFAQDTQCRAADYQKTIATTWYPIKNRQQATVGNIFELGQHLANKLQKQFNQLASNSVIATVEPYYLTLPKGATVAIELAHQANSQFVLFAEINSLATMQVEGSGLAFWQSPTTSRDFSLSTVVYDGSTGQQVFSKTQEFNAVWEFNTHENIDLASSRFWQSEFGKQLGSVMQDLTMDIDQTLSCLPAYGRVLYVDNNQISINLGQHNGLRKGDQLSLFQMNQFYDATGKLHQQFQLHPELVEVTQVFANSANVASLTGAPLVNIQANDFVARR